MILLSELVKNSQNVKEVGVGFCKDCPSENIQIFQSFLKSLNPKRIVHTQEFFFIFIFRSHLH